MKVNFFFLLLVLVLNKVSNIHLLAQSTSSPNIIFILTDDQKFDALSFLGHKYVKTPNLDRLAKAGVYFDNAVCTTPICAASRASILSGTYERNHRYTFESGVLDQALVSNSYPVLLRKAGYKTAHFGKLGVNLKNDGDLFDEVEDVDRNTAFKDKRGYFFKKIGNDTVHLTQYAVHKAVQFVKNQTNSKPFLLNLWLSSPHAHDSAKDQFFTFTSANPLVGVEIEQPILSSRANFEALPAGVQAGFSRTRWQWRFDTPEKYQAMTKAYYNMITELDGELKKLFDQLKTQKLDQNTVIIFMSDNGYLLGERQIADKWLMYESSVRVPLFIYDPRVKSKGKRVTDQVTNIDVTSTILALANQAIPQQYQGKSLSEIVNGKSQKPIHDTLLIEHLWEFDQIPPSEGLRTKEWKYLRYVNDRNWEELYNLSKDPIEQSNLSSKPDHREVLETFRKTLDRKIAQAIGTIALPPNGLCVEMIREPKHTKIQDLNPEFSWIIPASSKYQTAYQIIVADSKPQIDANIGNLWNAKQNANRYTTEADYQGKPLAYGKTYYWKVRYWDAANRLSDFSEAQAFTTAKVDEYISSPNFNQIIKYHAVSATPAEGGGTLYDFGKHAFGTVSFTYNSANADTLFFEVGEKLSADNRSLDSKPGGTIRYAKVKVPVKPGKYEYLLQFTPDVRNTLPIAVPMPKEYPVILPFKYATLLNKGIVIDPKDIYQSRYHVYWDESQSAFASNDTILNQVWDLCKYSIKATSFAGYYIDGDRERIPYEADAYLNQLSHYTTDKEYPLARRTIEWFFEYPTWPTEWQQHVALMVDADFMYTGNTDIIKKYYEALKYKSLMDLVGDNDLITSTKADSMFMKKLGFKDPKAKLRDITDWPPAQKDTQWKLATAEGERDGFEFKEYNTLINSLYYANLKILAKFAKIVDNIDDEIAFEAAAAKAYTAINTKLYDKAQGRYVDGLGSTHASLHANMFAMAFGLVPDGYKSSVVSFIKSRGMACSVYGAQYLLEALYMAGEDQYALDLMRSASDRGWYNMIKAGSTVTLEAWDLKYKPNLDWNHAWGAVPANAVAREMWGIKPIEPGAAVMSMKPQLGDLTQVALVVPTIRGQIKASFAKKNPRSEVYEVEVPGNMDVLYYFKQRQGVEIMHNTQPISPLSSYILLSPGKHIIEYKINSY
jgi:alpha-L-rhamnosidase